MNTFMPKYVKMQDNTCYVLGIHIYIVEGPLNANGGPQMQEW